MQFSIHARRTFLYLPLPRESIPSTISMSVCVCIKLMILWHASSRQGKEYLNVIRCMICLLLQAHMPTDACLQTLSRVLCDKVLDMCYADLHCDLHISKLSLLKDDVHTLDGSMCCQALVD